MALENGFSPLPKQVWAFWTEGPLPVFESKCVASWRRHLGAEWKIDIVDEKRLKQMFDDDWLPSNFAQLGHQKKANSARLALVRKFGGVWMDVTCFLTGPLDWAVHAVEREGKRFVGFSAPFFGPLGGRGDAIVENWWFAAPADSRIVREWHQAWVHWVGQSVGGEAGFPDLDLYKTADVYRLGGMRFYLIMHLILANLRETDEAFRAEFEQYAKVFDGEIEALYLNFNPTVSAEQLETHERDVLGHKIRFVKTNGQSRALKARVGKGECKKGSAEWQLFLAPDLEALAEKTEDSETGVLMATVFLSVVGLAALVGWAVVLKRGREKVRRRRSRVSR
jgi:hypothetical protein